MFFWFKYLTRCGEISGRHRTYGGIMDQRKWTTQDNLRFCQSDRELTNSQPVQGKLTTFQTSKILSHYKKYFFKVLLSRSENHLVWQNAIGSISKVLFRGSVPINIIFFSSRNNSHPIIFFIFRKFFSKLPKISRIEKLRVCEKAFKNEEKVDVTLIDLEITIFEKLKSRASFRRVI